MGKQIQKSLAQEDFFTWHKNLVYTLFTPTAF